MSKTDPVQGVFLSILRDRPLSISIQEREHLDIAIHRNPSDGFKNEDSYRQNGEKNVQVQPLSPSGG